MTAGPTSTWRTIPRPPSSTATTSTLYHNVGKGVFDDVTFPAGVGVNTRWLGWGCGFVDVDNDGWLDLFLVNGHVYPEVGGAVIEPTPARGCAFGDFDNDGRMDVLINPVNAMPELLHAESDNQNNWIKIRTVGNKSNRDGIGARVKCVTADGSQIDEVRSGGSYYSQNDLRIHFGVGKNQKIKAIEISWP